MCPKLIFQGPKMPSVRCTRKSDRMHVEKRQDLETRPGCACRPQGREPGGRVGFAGLPAACSCGRVCSPQAPAFACCTACWRPGCARGAHAVEQGPGGHGLSVELLAGIRHGRVHQTPGSCITLMNPALHAGGPGCTRRPHAVGRVPGGRPVPGGLPAPGGRSRVCRPQGPAGGADCGAR